MFNYISLYLYTYYRCKISVVYINLTKIKRTLKLSKRSEYNMGCLPDVKNRTKSNRKMKSWHLQAFQPLYRINLRLASSRKNRSECSISRYNIKGSERSNKTRIACIWKFKFYLASSWSWSWTTSKIYFIIFSRITKMYT